MEKAHIRKIYRDRRSQFKADTESYSVASKNLSRNIQHFVSSELQSGTLLLSYRAYKSEAQVPWLKGYRYAFPRINFSNLDLEFHETSNNENNFELNSYGILEPHLDHSNPVEGAEAALVFVPALAFDQEGFRLGSGKGFYDRFLTSLTGVLKVGIGFHIQLFSGLLPKDPWDIPVDWLITDRSITAFSRRK